ncbi:hypothetical protein [Nitrosospira multiformis]|uniref:hypothetical protein n=1 Tax=Nitrosospira multiformis TaxID=1231 RepID=UPI00210A9FCD|nr:hypothetical protein [Nitrosospira multiformis]
MKRGEQPAVEYLGPVGPIEALDESVLIRLARLDKAVGRVRRIVFYVGEVREACGQTRWETSWTVLYPSIRFSSKVVHGPS